MPLFRQCCCFHSSATPTSVAVVVVVNHDHYAVVNEILLIFIHNIHLFTIILIIGLRVICAFRHVIDVINFILTLNPQLLVIRFQLPLPLCLPFLLKCLWI